MKPVNEKEMNNSFLQFTLLFFVLLICCFFAFFFDGKVIQADNSALSLLKPGKSSKNPDEAKILIKADSLQKYLQKYEVAIDQGEIDVDKTSVSGYLSEFQTLVNANPSPVYMNLFKSYQADFRNIANLHDRNDELKNQKDVNDKLNSQLKDLQKEVDKMSASKP